MLQITMQELEEELKRMKNKTIILELRGMIRFIAKIEVEQVDISSDNIMIDSKQKIPFSIVLDKHQIMKIEKNEEDVVNIKFDAPQEVKIVVNTEKKE